MDRVSSDLPVSPPMVGGSGRDARVIIKESRWSVFLDWLPAMIVIPVYFFAYLDVVEKFSNRTAEDWIVQRGLIAPAILQVLLQFRMIPRITKLANKEYRVDLAGAPVQAKAVLLARLKSPILRGVASIGTVMVFQTAQLFLFRRDPPIWAPPAYLLAMFFISMDVIYIASCILISSSILLKLRRPKANSLSPLTLVLIYEVFISLLVLIFLTTFFSTRVKGGDPLPVVVVSITVALVVVALVVFRWKKLCDVYLKMEG